NQKREGKKITKRSRCSFSSYYSNLLSCCNFFLESLGSSLSPFWVVSVILQELSCSSSLLGLKVDFCTGTAKALGIVLQKAQQSEAYCPSQFAAEAKD
ncbi:Os03g0165300, partial [Oryza sativa Japonica Group]